LLPVSASCLLGSLLDLEDEGSMYLQNMKFSLNYKEKTVPLIVAAMRKNPTMNMSVSIPDPSENRTWVYCFVFVFYGTVKRRKQNVTVEGQFSFKQPKDAVFHLLQNTSNCSTQSC
jgi:hypothetical protein